MEPAAERREHGSHLYGRLTCADDLQCERSVKARRSGLLNGLVKVQKRPLTCVRPLPSSLVTTSALAIRR